MCLILSLRPWLCMTTDFGNGSDVVGGTDGRVHFLVKTYEKAKICLIIQS